MKVVELLEQDEWKNSTPTNKNVLRSLRKKLAAIQHQRTIVIDAANALRFTNPGPDAEKRKKLTSRLDAADQRITDLDVQRIKVQAELAKHSLNMKNVVHDPELAYRHAKSVRNGPFPEGEDAIASNARTAFDYAVNVLGGRFLKGEPAIVKVPELRNGYRQRFGTINYEYPPHEDK